MAKAVPVRVRLSENAVNPVCLQNSLEALHICVVMEVVREENYSEQQMAALLRVMRKKLLERMEGKLYA